VPRRSSTGIQALAVAGDFSCRLEGRACSDGPVDEYDAHDLSRCVTPEPPDAHLPAPLQQRHTQQEHGGRQEQPRNEQHASDGTGVKHVVSPSAATDESNGSATAVLRHGAELEAGARMGGA
jgi:hypothetical protein